MILKSVLCSRDHLGLGDPERHEEPEEEVDHWIFIETKKMEKIGKQNNQLKKHYIHNLNLNM